jgi:hypothetical protein
MSTPLHFDVDFGTDASGIKSTLKVEGDQMVSKQTYDAEPILKACHDARVLSEGKRWGDGQTAFKVPLAVLYDIHQRFDSVIERQAQLMIWIRNNPKFIAFDGFKV